MEPSKESLESALLSHRQRKPGESVEYFTPAFESELRTWGVKDSVLDLVSNISGGGILSLPFAFQCTGPMLGAALVGAAGAGSAWTIYALAALGRRTGAPSYAGIARHVYGRWLQLGVVFLVFASTFICMVTYTIFLQGIIVPLFEDYWFGDDAQAYTLPTTARVSLVGLVLIAAAPLCFPTTIRHLGFTNLLTVVCTGIFAIVLFLKALKACDAAALAAMDHRWTNPDPSAYLDQGVPIIVAAFLCHFNVLPVHNALQRPTRRRFKQVVSWTLFLTTITYLIIGLSGYFYGKCIQEDVSADIFLSFSNRDLLATLGRIAMFLVLIFSYPYFIIPCRESLDDLRLILNDSFVGHGDELGPAREFSRSSATPCGRQHLGLPPPSPAEESGGPPDTLPAADDDEPAEPAGRASCGGGGGGAAAADSPGEGCNRLLSGSPECAGCGLCAAGELLGGRPDAGESDNLSRFSDGNSLNGLYLGKSAVATTKRDVAATFGLLAVQLVISALVPELELWWNILGSFVTVALVFIFPCAAYIELRGRRAQARGGRKGGRQRVWGWLWRQSAAHIVLAASTFSMLVCSLYSVLEWWFLP